MMNDNDSPETIFDKASSQVVSMELIERTNL